MFICHACSRRTYAVRTGPQELACGRCAVVGFVEELTDLEGSGAQPSRGPLSQEERARATRRAADPFRLFNLFMRDVGMAQRESVMAAPSRNGGGVTVVTGGPAGNIALLGNLSNGLLPFVPDAVTRLLTDENFDNLVSLILAQQEGTDEGPPPAAVSVRNSLPSETLTKATAAAYGECTICQESFADGETVNHITKDRDKCPHVFHPKCILPWLELHNTCPVCRYQLRTDDNAFERRRQTVERNLSRSLSSRGNSRATTAQGQGTTAPTQSGLARTTTVGGYRPNAYSPTGPADEGQFLGTRYEAPPPPSLPPRIQPSEAVTTEPPSTNNAARDAPEIGPERDPARVADTSNTAGLGRLPTSPSVPAVELQPRRPQLYATVPRDGRRRQPQESRPNAASQFFADIRNGFNRLFEN